jgi:hypothetical protein
MTMTMIIAGPTFQSVITISSPKIVGEGGGGVSDMPFFTNLARFVQFFSNIFIIFRNLLLNYIFFARRACR